MSKFITNLLRHGEFGREEDARVPYMIELLRKQGSSVRGFKILVRRNKTKIKHRSALVSGEVDRRYVKRWWTKERVSILFETKSSRKTPVPSSHSRSFRKSLFWKCPYQSCIARQCAAIEGFYQVCLSRNGLVPGGFTTKTGRYAVFFTVVDPMDDKRGLRETFCDLPQARIAPF